MAHTDRIHGQTSPSRLRRVLADLCFAIDKSLDGLVAFPKQSQGLDVHCDTISHARFTRQQITTSMNASTNIATLPVSHHRIKPSQIAHFVIYTSQFEEATAWYKAMLNCTATFENDRLAFLTYDDEHHRVAIASMPGLTRQPTESASIHHIAFTYSTLLELLLTWKRLSELDILPYWTVNHGPTTSMYYADPDGNRIEFQVDNFSSSAEAIAFCALPEFMENSVGVEFEPEDLLRRLNNGESEAVLKRRPNIGPRSIATSRA